MGDRREAERAESCARRNEYLLFVIASEKPFPKTDLTAGVIFNRIVLAGGKLGDSSKDVKIEK
jgi:hypothetical protein